MSSGQAWWSDQYDRLEAINNRYAKSVVDKLLEMSVSSFSLGAVLFIASLQQKTTLKFYDVKRIREIAIQNKIKTDEPFFNDVDEMLESV